MAFAEYAWLIPIFPLIAFIVVGFLGNKLFKKWESGAPIAIGMTVISLVLALLVAFETLTGDGTPFIQSIEWLVVQSGDFAFQFNMGIYIDNLTALMLIVSPSSPPSWSSTLWGTCTRRARTSVATTRSSPCSSA